MLWISCLLAAPYLYLGAALLNKGLYLLSLLYVNFSISSSLLIMNDPLVNIVHNISQMIIVGVSIFASPVVDYALKTSLMIVNIVLMIKVLSVILNSYNWDLKFKALQLITGLEHIILVLCMPLAHANLVYYVRMLAGALVFSVSYSLQIKYIPLISGLWYMYSMSKALGLV